MTASIESIHPKAVSAGEQRFTVAATTSDIVKFKFDINDKVI